jgi:hypothetical protein
MALVWQSGLSRTLGRFGAERGSRIDRDRCIGRDGKGQVIDPDSTKLAQPLIDQHIVPKEAFV